MIEITVLGTSGSAPAKNRQMPAVSLKYGSDLFFFDCGEGTQAQALKYDINTFKLKAIFLTHAHGDHVIGIAGLIRTLALNDRKDELMIFIPRGYENIIRNLILFDKSMIGYVIKIIGIKPGIVYKGRNFTVSAFKLNHTISTYGYVFKENDKRRFIKEKSRKLGIKGLMFAELEKKGSIKVNSKIIKINDITKLQIGRKVVYATDTRPTKSTIKAAKDADLLIHESSYSEEHKDLATSRKHSTSIEAATIAKKANAKALMLIHFSTRYKTIKHMESEAKGVFKNTIIPNDGYRFSL